MATVAHMSPSSLDLHCAKYQVKITQIRSAWAFLRQARRSVRLDCTLHNWELGMGTWHVSSMRMCRVNL